LRKLVHLLLIFHIRNSPAQPATMPRYFVSCVDKAAITRTISTELALLLRPLPCQQGQRIMSATNSINGYLIKNVSPNEWWISDSSEEKVAGPFESEQAAIEVASVLQDQPTPAARRRNSKP
jgi:hypothetical protein